MFNFRSKPTVKEDHVRHEKFFFFLGVVSINNTMDGGSSIVFVVAFGVTRVRQKSKPQNGCATNERTIADGVIQHLRLFDVAKAVVQTHIATAQDSYVNKEKPQSIH